MKRRNAIAAVFAAIALGALSGAAIARDCGAGCIESVQNRGERDRPGAEDRSWRRPYLNAPTRNIYGGPEADRSRAVDPGVTGREPLADGQIWAIAKSRVPGRIVSARLQGQVYSFRIVSNRGSIVDVVVDRYSGRIVSVRGGP